LEILQESTPTDLLVMVMLMVVVVVVLTAMEMV
jgi:hypothetical protein